MEILGQISSEKQTSTPGQCWPGRPPAILEHVQAGQTQPLQTICWPIISLGPSSPVTWPPLSSQEESPPATSPL